MKFRSFLINATLITALAGGLTGCSKDFLDEPAPSQSVGYDEAFRTATGVRSVFSGLYRNMRTQWGTATDAWGLVSVNLAREVKGIDVVIPYNDWYTFDYEHDNREPTYRRVVFTWNFFYQQVNSANNIIAGVTASTALSPEEKERFLAEARAIRAWCYFELVREFAHAYNENPQGRGVPLYTEPTEVETEGKPRATVAEVFKLITDDLEWAVTRLDVDRPQDNTIGEMKDVINKNVGYGLLARVYLEMSQWEKARDAAEEALDGYDLNPDEYSTAFNRIDKPEVIWGFPQSADQTIYYGTPSAFWGMWEATSPGYYQLFLDKNFVNLFSLTDKRRGANEEVIFATDYYQQDFGDFKTKKFGTSTNFTDHIPMMRASEMVLIIAEAKAELGEGDAGDVLFYLQETRDPQAVQSGNTGDALVNEILVERRKELYGEIGVSFLDIKRRQLPLVRSDGHPEVYRVSLPANSNGFTLKIPQTEIDANVSLTDADQNP